MASDRDIGALRACVRSAVRPMSDVRRALRRKGVDWNRLAALAHLNGLAPLVYHTARENGLQPAIPDAVCRLLSGTYYSVALQNARYLEELRAILLAFRGAGVPVVVLKGAAIAERVWGNVALRRMGDLDLLVREEHLDRTHDLMVSLAYEPRAGRRGAPWYRDHHHLAPYHKNAAGSEEKAVSDTDCRNGPSGAAHNRCLTPFAPVVEIHRTLVRPGLPFDVNVGGLWHRAQPAVFGGAPALVLSPDDLVTHLCLHVAGDEPFVGKVRDLLDIALVLCKERGRVDWNTVVRDAREHGYAPRLYYALAGAGEVAAAPVDQALLGTLRRTVPFSTWEDRILRAFIRRHAFLRMEGEAVVPKWALQEVGVALLADAPPDRKLIDLGRRLRSPSLDGGRAGPPGEQTRGVQMTARVVRAVGRHLRGAVFA